MRRARVKFAASLKKWRTVAGLTQADAAKELGHSPECGGQYISNWEREISLPPIGELPLLAKLYGVPLKELADLQHARKYEEADNEWAHIMGLPVKKRKKK